MNTAQSMSQPDPSSDLSTSSGGRLVTTDGRTLPLRGAELHTDARGGIARVVLSQRFENPYAEPLSVTYSLPLPADAAVSGFSFRIGERRVVGEIDGRKAARERYEQALIEGRSAALLEQDRTSLFTQEIGNIPPGEEVHVEVILDQQLRWLDEGAWEWRFPTVVAPRYLGAAGRVVDAARVAQDVAAGPLPVRMALACVIRDPLAKGRKPESPSHPLSVTGEAGAARVALGAEGGVRLDRDVVVRWAVGAAKVGLSLDLGRPSAERASATSSYGLLTVVPPAPSSPARSVCRDLIVLLDTSGSMSGEPLSQAVRVVSALIETLRDDDRLELIEFSNRARRWKSSPVAATSSARRDALDWLAKLRASGSTEMRDGILEAMRTLRPESQRQVVLITDGMIGFESEVVAAICEKLPASSRLHTVGVGSAVNRSLTGPGARAGRGVEVMIGLGEDPERAAARLVSRTRAPILVELELSGAALVGHAPRRLPDLFAGAPALIGVALRPEGGDLRLRGRTAEGTWEQRIVVPAMLAGAGNQAAATLFGREAVEDLELRLAAGGDVREIDPTIERFGIDFQIATRLTSWIAVTQETTVDPRDPTRRERMPHELAHGVSAEGLGLRAARDSSVFPTVDLLARSMGGMQGAAPPPPPAFGAPPPMAMAESRFDADDFASLLPLGAADRGAGGGQHESAKKASMIAPASLGRVSAPRPPAPTGAPPAASPMSPPAPLSPQKAKAAEATRAESASTGERAKGEGGLIGAVKRFFTGAKSKADEGEAPAVAMESMASATRVLRGRLVLQRNGEVVIEIEVTGDAVAWNPDGAAELLLDDGRVLSAAVLAARSTRAGAIAVGARIRLALALPSEAAPEALRTITLHRGGQPSMIITL